MGKNVAVPPPLIFDRPPYDASASSLPAVDDDAENAAEDEDIFNMSVAAARNFSPPSFVDVYGLHARPSGKDTGRENDFGKSGHNHHANNNGGNVELVNVRDALLTPNDAVDGHEHIGSGEGGLPRTSSSLSLLPSSSSYHNVPGGNNGNGANYGTSAEQNMALSLNKQIENVDAGLENIKDALVMGNIMNVVS